MAAARHVRDPAHARHREPHRYNRREDARLDSTRLIEIVRSCVDLLATPPVGFIRPRSSGSCRRKIPGLARHFSSIQDSRTPFCVVILSAAVAGNGLATAGSSSTTTRDAWKLLVSMAFPADLRAGPTDQKIQIHAAIRLLHRFAIELHPAAVRV